MIKLFLPPSADALFSNFRNIRLKHAEQHLFTSDGTSVMCIRNTCNMIRILKGFQIDKHHTIQYIFLNKKLKSLRKSPKIASLLSLDNSANFPGNGLNLLTFRRAVLQDGIGHLSIRDIKNKLYMDYNKATKNVQT